MTSLFCCFEKFLAYTLFLPSFIVVRHQMAELNWGGFLPPPPVQTPSKIGLTNLYARILSALFVPMSLPYCLRVSPETSQSTVLQTGYSCIDLENKIETLTILTCPVLFDITPNSIFDCHSSNLNFITRPFC